MTESRTSRAASLLPILTLGAAVACGGAPETHHPSAAQAAPTEWPTSDDSLKVQFVGNEGVVLSDGNTTLLVDLPYESGAFGYMLYDHRTLDPTGRAVSVITHRHRDHFDSKIFVGKGWEIVAAREITDALPDSLVVPLSDTVEVGSFRIIPHATDHSDTEHYSYLVTWRSRRLYFVGDTEEPDSLLAAQSLDVAFVSSWLDCAVTRSGGRVDAARVVLYHHFPSRRHGACSDPEVMQQGRAFYLHAG